MDKSDNFKLTEALKDVKQVLINEGDLEVERIIITKDQFMVVINGNVFTVNDYK